MSEYFGGDYIYGVLSTDSSIFDYIGNAIYNGLVVPNTDPVTGEDPGTETVNFYRLGDLAGGVEVFNQNWSADCRSSNEKTSRDIAYAVYQALNRGSGEAGGKTYFAIASVGQTLPPANDQDVYNTPVTIQLRRR